MFALIEAKLLDLQLIPRRPGLDQLDDRTLADLGVVRAELRQAQKRRR